MSQHKTCWHWEWSRSEKAKQISSKKTQKRINTRTRNTPAAVMRNISSSLRIWKEKEKLSLTIIPTLLQRTNLTTKWCLRMCSPQLYLIFWADLAPQWLRTARPVAERRTQWSVKWECSNKSPQTNSTILTTIWAYFQERLWPFCKVWSKRVKNLPWRSRCASQMRFIRSTWWPSGTFGWNRPQMSWWAAKSIWCRLMKTYLSWELSLRANAPSARPNSTTARAARTPWSGSESTQSQGKIHFASTTSRS